MRRMKSLVAMAILAAVVGLSTPSAFAAGDGIYLGDRAVANTGDGIYLGDKTATGIIFSLAGIYLGDITHAGIYLGD